MVAAGSPVCATSELPSACEEFESFARSRGCVICYVCVEERLRKLFASSVKHAAVALGAQPVWDPRQWSATVANHRSVRAQINRSRNKGVSIQEMAPVEAAANPELRRVLREWLTARRLPPLHFLVEPDVLDGVMGDRVVFAARQNGAVVAFLAASPITAKRGYLIELLSRSPSAPNGTSELLIDAAMRRFAGEDREYVSMGLVALAHAADASIQMNPIWLRGVMRFARMHANRFYNFRGLERFRVKLRPSAWEPLYAISNEQRFSPVTFYGMFGAFSGIPPWMAVGIGAAKAAREEVSNGLQRAGKLAKGMIL